LARYFLRHCAHFGDVSDDVFYDMFYNTSLFIMIDRGGGAMSHA
jgi:hypothetical protein